MSIQLPNTAGTLFSAKILQTKVPIFYWKTLSTFNIPKRYDTQLHSLLSYKKYTPYTSAFTGTLFT